MILYGVSLSPFVRKVLIYAAEKGIQLELKPVTLGQPDPEFLEISPFGKMPGFRDGDFAISDSTAIITYLEAKQREPSLTPHSPEDKARAVWFEEFADTILVGAVGKVFFNRVVAKLIGREGDPAVADKALAEEAPPIYAYLEKIIPAPGEWLVGGRLSVADIAVVSPLVNMFHCGGSPDPETYPRLAAWTEVWFGRASLQTLIERERKMLGRK